MKTSVCFEKPILECGGKPILDCDILCVGKGDELCQVLELKAQNYYRWKKQKKIDWGRVFI